jgi:serine/threonine protein kinase
VVLGAADHPGAQEPQEEEIVQLELLEKVADENLAEAFLARLSVDGEVRLVTARRLLKQVADVPGVLDALGGVSAAMKRIEHAGILRHIGFGEAGDSHYWVTERTDGFDLAMAINRLSSREVHINPVRSLQIGLDFLQGLQILHQQGLLHGGLSPGYVLVGYDGVARLDGIGLESTLLQIKDLKQKSRRQRSAYLSPEVAQGRSPVPQSDVFSAAAILYTLLTGAPPMEKEGTGAGMSIRHSTIELPSKLDRNLPFSCDAIFLKALSVAPRQRHESIESFTAAIKRLRAAMLKGPDDERAGVKDFVENLFPNEAIVPGKPGSIDKPATGEGLRLIMLPGEPKPAPAPEIPEPEATETVPAEEKVDEEALARVAAWEAAFGKAGKPEEKKPATPGPPPLKGRSMPARPPPFPGEKKKEDEGSAASSVVVDWMELGEEKESEDTEEVRPGQVSELERPLEPEPPPEPPVAEPAPEPEAQEPEVEQEEPTPIRTEKIPTLVVEKDEEEQTEPEKSAEEVLSETDTSPEDKIPDEISKQHDTIQMPPVVDPGPPDDQAPVFKKKVPWKAVAILAAIVVAVVLALVFWPKGEDEAPGDTAGASSIAFLSVHTTSPAKVTLDGELIEGTTPLKDKVMRAGKHRVMVDSLDGTRLMDEVVVLQAGEHKDIRVVIAAAPAKVEPSGEEVKPVKPAVKKKKKRRKKRVRRKRRRTRR